MHRFRTTFAALALLAPLGAHADTWPTRQITIVVPFPAGGAADAIARAVQPMLAENLGTSVVVLNRPGARGAIGTSEVIRAKPDGYTLLLGDTSGLVGVPAIMANPPYDPLVLSHVSLLAFSHFVLVVKEKTAGSVDELMARSKQKGLSCAYGHVPGQLLCALANRVGIAAVPVPYQGDPPAVMDVLGGSADFIFGTPTTTLPHVKAPEADRRLRVLALVGTKGEQNPFVPDVISTGESGFGDFNLKSWFGLFAPAGVEGDIMKRLNGATTAALRNVTIQSAIRRQSLIAVDPNSEEATPEGLRRFVAAQLSVAMGAIAVIGIPKEK